jgi:hypothetical protein
VQLRCSLAAALGVQVQLRCSLAAALAQQVEFRFIFFSPRALPWGSGAAVAAVLAYFMSKVAPSRLLCKTNQPVLPPKLNVDPILALCNIVTTLQTTLGALQSS